jgi:CDP-alcohol phosphatidyltransferase-like enzyme
MTSGVTEMPTAARPDEAGSAGASAAGVTTAVLLATAPAAGGGPAALQPWAATTVLRRALDQLAALGIGDVRVVTRPAWAAAVGDAVPAAVRVHVASDPAGDLRVVAEIARGAGGALGVALGDIVTHQGALGGLLDDVRIRTAALVARTRTAGRFAPRVRERGGRVVSAASPYHSVHHASGAFLGALKIAAPDAPALAAIAERLAVLWEARPAGWDAELARKATRWRESLGAQAEAPVAAAQQDVVSLLLAGLVRHGVPVTRSSLRRLFWARPLSFEAVTAAEERIADYDEDRLLLDAAVKRNDGFFTTFFVSPYSRFVARWAARRGFTPNQVTTASLLLGLVAAAAFATGERWALIAGAVLLQVSFMTDCVDGQLARYTRTFSKLGAWLDSIFDRTKEYAVFAGLAIGAAQAGDGVWLLAGAALALQTVRHMIYVGFRETRPPAAELLHPPIEQPSDRHGAGQALELEEPDEEAEDAPPEPEPAPAGPRPLPRRVLRSWGRFARLPLVTWPRKMIPFPIGERFAAISLTAALFTPRTTFVVLLAWGGVAAAYTFTGRVLRSIA